MLKKNPECGFAMMPLMFILRGVFLKLFQNISRPRGCLFAKTARVVNDVVQDNVWNNWYLIKNKKKKKKKKHFSNSHFLLKYNIWK